MLLKSLRTNIAINVVVLLLLSMLLIDLVMLMVNRKSHVDAQIEKARMLVAALEGTLPAGPGAAASPRPEIAPGPVGRLMAVGGGRCVDVFSRDGRSIYRSGPGCPSETAAGALALQAALENREIVQTAGFFSGIFARRPGDLILAAPLRAGTGIDAGAVVTMSMNDIFDRLRRSQHILLIYILVNTIILTLWGVYRLNNLTVKPIQRLVRRAEAFRDSDDNVFLLEREDNEFRKLSKSLNRMLAQLAEDKGKLQKSVHSLESANRDLEKAQRELIRAEKLASVGRLSAGIAHEIGNPIGIIKGYLVLLKDPAMTDEEKADFVARTESEIERIHSIIQQLLDFSRPSGEEQEVVSVHAVLAELEDVCRFQPVLAPIRIVLHLDAPKDRVVANARQLRQVFLNLVLNAADAIGDVGREGTLEIFTENPVASAAGSAAPDSLTIRFVDDGSGIPEENLTNIFDPFFTTKAPGKGTGLGLSVSFTIIEGLGGAIKAEQNVDGGARMIIRLPLAERLPA